MMESLSFRSSIADIPSKELAFAKMPPALNKISMGDRRERWPLVLLVTVPFALFYGGTLWFDGPIWALVLLLVAFLYWSLIAPFLTARQALLLRAKSMRRLAPHNAPVDVHISEAGVSLKSIASSVAYEWCGYSGLTRSQSGAFMWFGLGRYVFVPNKVLPKEVTWEAFEAQVKEWSSE